MHAYNTSSPSLRTRVQVLFRAPIESFSQQIRVRMRGVYFSLGVAMPCGECT